MICHEDPEAIKKWHDESNYVVVVSVPDEDSLLALADHACWKNDVPCWVFVEPDLGNQHTALALRPGPDAGSICGSLPLAMKEVSV